MNPEEQQNYRKALLFKISIVFIVIVIFFLWSANLKNVFKSQEMQSANTFEKIKQDIDKSFQEADENFRKMASSTSAALVEELINKASSTATSSNSTTTAKIEIRKELSDLIKATATPRDSSCPPYINCMPSIGEARPCIVPPGCEGITQIAY